jgi:hypothetical protein
VLRVQTGKKISHISHVHFPHIFSIASAISIWFYRWRWGSFSTLRCKAGGFGKQQGSAKPTMHECISRQKSLEKIDREKRKLGNSGLDSVRKDGQEKMPARNRSSEREGTSVESRLRLTATP